jgi:hypothetical protein
LLDDISTIGPLVVPPILLADCLERFSDFRISLGPRVAIFDTSTQPGREMPQRGTALDLRRRLYDAGHVDLVQLAQRGGEVHGTGPVLQRGVAIGYLPDVDAPPAFA